MKTLYTISSLSNVLSNFTKNVWRFCHPRIFQFLMANNSLVIKAEKLTIGDLTKFNTFFHPLKLILPVLVFEERGNPENPEKNLPGQGENQQPSQPT